MVNGEGPWHMSAGTWNWVRSMYGLAMHQTGAELDTDVHLQIFDQALAIRDRKLLEAEHQRIIGELVLLAEGFGGQVTVDQLRGVGDLLRQGAGQPPPDGSPAVRPPAGPGSGSV